MKYKSLPLAAAVIAIGALSLSACAKMTTYCPEQSCKAPAAVPAPVPLGVPAPVILSAPAPQSMAPMVIHGVSFRVNSYQLNPSATNQLSKIVKYANKYPNTVFHVNGYCSKLGGYAYNQKLSVERAKSVAKYLEANGVSASRIVSVKGFGYSDPVATNSTAAGRYLNQRVEVVPVKK